MPRFLGTIAIHLKMMVSLCCTRPFLVELSLFSIRVKYVILVLARSGGYALIDKLSNLKTLVHEGGHWVGLYHTFMGGCLPPGDYVADTSPEASPTYGCPSRRQSCSYATSDPIRMYLFFSLWHEPIF